jgi:hypothetical protein
MNGRRAASGRGPTRLARSSAADSEIRPAIVWMKVVAELAVELRQNVLRRQDGDRVPFAKETPD